MAMFLFTDAIINNKPLQVFNNGNLSCGFTYIEDIVLGVLATLFETSEVHSKYKICNFGNSQLVQLLEYKEAIELAINKQAIQIIPMKTGDIKHTYADFSSLKRD